MHRYWRAEVVLDVAASDDEIAHNLAFAVFIEACRKANQERIGMITRPVHDLHRPHRGAPYLNRCRITYPPPVDEGEKVSHRVGVDLEYVKVEGDWDNYQEARQWLAGLFQQVQTEDVRLTAIKDSIVHWN